MIVNRDNVLNILRELDSARALKNLFVRELGYDSEGGAISSDDWPEDVIGTLAGNPMLLASTASDGRFTVIHARLSTAGKLSLVSERRILDRLRQRYPFSLYVFSDAEDKLWHFVNAPHVSSATGTDSEAGSTSKQYRRIVVGPDERLRTATERLSMLSVDDLAEKSGKESDELSPLEVQRAHDRAFDVEPVTNEFFREYARVFSRVEGLVEGIANEATERKRLFTQRLFNRLMFLAFIQKKGWLRFGERQDYLPALFDACREDEYDENFYRDRLKHLFFVGLNTPHEVDIVGINEGGYLRDVIGDVPYLNGGLFEKDEDDRDETVVVPDEAIALILQDLFGQFNFTITESTPLDVEVAVDPEMLGRVFEELVTGRHETGSYYTPKPIVSFMCREALKGHLDAKLPQDSPEAIGRFVEEHDPSSLRDPERALEALRSVRVCDPACGSGAYLLGMLHELLDLRASLFATRSLDPISNYDRKLEIIQRNLYGVDIDPFAVNIARLRLWLSLVVEFEDEEDRKPPPLPNLDFKIEVGDSLIAPDPSGGFELDMVRDEQVSRLEGLKAGFLKAHGEEKKSLRGEIDALRREIAAWAHPDKEVSGFDWQVEFAEVFADDGFDVVVANPPYVRQELIRPLKPTLERRFPEAYKSTADLYVYFYARALQILADGGMLAFISTNKWFRTKYGSKLRKHVADTTQVKSITDFGDLPVFKSASAYPMIFLTQKGGDRDEVAMLTEPESLAPPYPEVAQLVRKVGRPMASGALNGSDWSIVDAPTAERLNRMRAAGTTLGEYVRGQVFYGIKTGLSKAFTLTSERRDELISLDANSSEIIKPLATGKNLKKWAVDYSSQWLIVTPIGIDIENYPAVFEHLEQWQPQLDIRADKGKHWWELRACDYYDAFEQPKIMYQAFQVKPAFAYDPIGGMTNNSIFFISMDDLYLLGILNSCVFWSEIKRNCTKIQNGYQLIWDYLAKCIVPNPSSTDREAIAELAYLCAEAKGVCCEEIEREIDERVAALYGLSGGL